MFLLWILHFAALAAASSIVFEDCGSEYELTSVDIDGCGLSLPCYVTLGDDVPVTLHYYASYTSNNLDQQVVININHINLRTPVTPERCEIDECPVRTGVLSELKSVMSVPTSMALNQRGVLRWRIENENGKQVLCYSVLVQTQSQLQKLVRQYMNTVLRSDDDPS